MEHFRKMERASEHGFRYIRLFFSLINLHTVDCGTYGNLLLKLITVDSKVKTFDTASSNTIGLCVRARVRVGVRRERLSKGIL